MGLDPKEVARFIVTQSNWSTNYHGPAPIPRRYVNVSIESLTSGRSELLRELRKLLPSMMVGAFQGPQEPFEVLFADLKDIKRIQATYPDSREEERPASPTQRKTKRTFSSSVRP
jgi:hypothetical protein